MKSDTGPGVAFDAAAFSDDIFLGDALRILQPLKGARAGIDAVFLAAMVPGRPGQRLLEAGIGSGVAGLCLLARHNDPATHLTGVDIQANMVLLAEENARRNGLAEQTVFIEADITAPARQLADKGLRPDHYDHVFANPPFLNEDSARLPPDAAKARAHALAPHDLARWLTFLVRSARPAAP
jgi:tRNA1(Val) A37 N6-methylase TrmN6